MTKPKLFLISFVILFLVSLVLSSYYGKLSADGCVRYIKIHDFNKPVRNLSDAETLLSEYIVSEKSYSDFFLNEVVEFNETPNNNFGKEWAVLTEYFDLGNTSFTRRLRLNEDGKLYRIGPC